MRCSLCGENVENVFRHRWEKHQDEMRATAQKGRETLHRAALTLKAEKNQPSSHQTTSPSPGTRTVLEAASEAETEEPQDKSKDQNGQSRRGGRGKQGKNPLLAESLSEAAFISIIPKEIRTTSTLFQIAKHITEVEEAWGPWPVMEEGEWLDNYLYWSMRKFGYRIGGYVAERRDGQPPHE